MGRLDCDFIERPSNQVQSLRFSDLQSDQLVYAIVNVFAFAGGRSGRACVQVGLNLNRLLHSDVLEHAKQRKAAAPTRTILHDNPSRAYSQ